MSWQWNLLVEFANVQANRLAREEKIVTPSHLKEKINRTHSRSSKETVHIFTSCAYFIMFQQCQILQILDDYAVSVKTQQYVTFVKIYRNSLIMQKNRTVV